MRDKKKLTCKPPNHKKLTPQCPLDIQKKFRVSKHQK